MQTLSCLRDLKLIPTCMTNINGNADYAFPCEYDSLLIVSIGGRIVKVFCFTFQFSKKRDFHTLNKYIFYFEFSANLSHEMSNQPVHLASLNREELKKFFDSFDTIFTDCDGMFGGLFLLFNRMHINILRCVRSG